MAEASAKAEVLDFTNVKERTFNTKHLPEGNYPAVVKSVEATKTKSGDKRMWVFTIALTGAHKGASYPHRCTLEESSLWKIRQLFVAAGFNVPKSRIKLDPNKAVGREVGVTLEDDEYDNKMRSQITAVIPLSEVGEAPVALDDAEEDDVEEPEDAPLEETEDEEPAPAPKAAKKAAKPTAAEVTDEDLEELEVEEL